MNFLHYDFNLGQGESVEVTLDKQANVRLLDDVNFDHYQRGEKHAYFGGLVEKSPTYLRPPTPGHWHVVIDLGGYPGTVRASVNTVQM